MLKSIMKRSISTFSHQSTLPRLPVPTLKETCTLYLQSLKPLLTPSEYTASEAKVTAFVKSDQAKSLQSQLEQKAAQSPGSSWLIDWWNDYAYMSYRDPIVIWVSYFFVFKDDPKICGNPAARAATLTRSAFLFRSQLVDETLEPDAAKNSPLCMQQIPAAPSDITRTVELSNENGFIVVVRKNKFFKLPVVVNGKLLSVSELERQFKCIYQLSGSVKGPAVGLFTTENRDTWTSIRQNLLRSPINAASLDEIERAAFVVCLDDSSPITRIDASRACWHGDGANRFFDKSLQFIVFENGKAGFNGEHSRMDATPPNRLCDWILSSLDAGTIDYGVDSGKAMAYPAKLEFELDYTAEKALQVAQEKFKTLVSGQSLNVVYYPAYGKNLIKKFKVSPDAYAQMAIQLAYYKMNGYVRATYESAQTKTFEWGRTETCRSVSSESLAWVKAMTDPSVHRQLKASLGRTAMQSQSAYMQKCISGRGVDRHFLGLKLLAGKDLPELFQDENFKKSCHWNLSTSQIPSEWYDGYGWGEVVPDGWGVAYMVNETSLLFNLTCAKASGFNGDVFQHYFFEALDDMKLVFESDQLKAKL